MGSFRLHGLNCPHCKVGKLLATNDSRPHEIEGIPTIKRRRTCRNCGARVSTFEVHEWFLVQKSQNIALALELIKSIEKRLLDKMNKD